MDIREALAKERALRDNAQWGEWEEDDLASLLAELKLEGSELDLLGFDERELQALLDKLSNEGGLTDPDAVPPLPDEPVTQTGDLWLLGPHRILCGDSTDPHDVAIVMNGEKAKLLATDPPYLVDYTGGNHPPSKANRIDTVGSRDASSSLKARTNPGHDSRASAAYGPTVSASAASIMARAPSQSDPFQTGTVISSHRMESHPSN